MGVFSSITTSLGLIFFLLLFYTQTFYVSMDSWWWWWWWWKNNENFAITTIHRGKCSMKMSKEREYRKLLFIFITGFYSSFLGVVEFWNECLFIIQFPWSLSSETKQKKGTIFLSNKTFGIFIDSKKEH